MCGERVKSRYHYTAYIRGRSFAVKLCKECLEFAYERLSQQNDPEVQNILISLLSKKIKNHEYNK